MSLAKQCKEKADEFKGKVTEAKDDSTSCKKGTSSELSTSPLDQVSSDEFKEIAVDVQKWVKRQLEKENKLTEISNDELRNKSK